MRYKLIYTKRAIKDIEKLKTTKIDCKAKNLVETLIENPLPNNCKTLTGNLKGKYSIRINIKHRLVYEIYHKTKEVKILSMWTHYE